MKTNRTRAAKPSDEDRLALSTPSTNSGNVPVRRSVSVSRITKLSRHSRQRQLSLNDQVSSLEYYHMYFP